MSWSRASINATAAEAIGGLWRSTASGLSADERGLIDSFFQRNAKRLARYLTDAVLSALGEHGTSIFDLTLEEFRVSPAALIVRAGSVLSVDPQGETVNSLERFPKSHLQMLASVTGAPRSGTKSELAEHILSVWKIRKDLSEETVESLTARRADDLRVLLDQLHLFKGGNKRTKAVTLVNWRNAVKQGQGTRGARQLAQHHFDSSFLRSVGVLPRSLRLGGETLIGFSMRSEREPACQLSVWMRAA